MSFPTDRKQYVKIKNYNSYFYNASSGVPQGCDLAPLLFNLFTNDTEVTNNYRYLLIAEYLKLFRFIDSSWDSMLLKNDLDSINEWRDMNNLFLNVHFEI